MDVNRRESQVDERGSVVLEQRIRTDRARFAALFGGRRAYYSGILAGAVCGRS